MTRKEFSKEIKTNFTELYIEAFINKYFQLLKMLINLKLGGKYEM